MRYQNVVTIHPFLMRSSIYDPGILKIATLFSDGLLSPYWTSSYYLLESNMRDLFLEKVCTLEGEKISRKLGKYWKNWDEVQNTSNNINPVIFRSTIGPLINVLLIQLGVCVEEEWQMSSLNLQSIIFSNMYNIPVVVDLNDVVFNFYMKDLSMMENEDYILKSIEQNCGHENLKNLLLLWAKGILIPYSKKDFNTDSFSILKKIIDIEVPDFFELNFSDILWLKKHIPELSNLNCWFAHKITEHGYDIRNLRDSDVSDFLTEQLWKLAKQVTPNINTSVALGILGNIPLPIPVNPVSVATTANDVLEKTKVSKNYQGIFAIAQIRDFLTARF